MRLHRDSQLSEADTFDMRSCDLEPDELRDRKWARTAKKELGVEPNAVIDPTEVFPPDPWAEALIACFDYMRVRPTAGAMRLYEAVNHAWVWFTRPN